MSLKENTCKKHSRRKWWIPLIIVFVTLATITNFALVYFNDFYEADVTVSQAMKTDENVEVVYHEGESIVFIPENIRAGLIFYPGGKVEFTAYAPLMRELAQNGIFCVLVHMPCNLAVFDMDAAEEYVQEYKEIDRWYIGGHSLGGSMAASYAAKASQDFDGVILCASYSTAELQNLGLEVLSIYGTNDGVLNMEKYLAYKENLPVDFEEEIIEGGCHAFFGCYGRQDGDGEPSISNREQIHTTVDFIVNFCDCNSISNLEKS